MKKLILSLLVAGLALNNQAQIINSSFENWSVDTWDSPDYAESSAGDITHPVKKSTDKYQGNYAVKMENYINDDNQLSPSYLLFGVWRDQGPESGYPYTQKPSTITGYYKASLQANDSAVVGAVFFKAGAVVDQEYFFLTTSQSTFTNFSFNLTTLSVTPDSALLVITSANPFGSGNISSNGWIIYDYIRFGGAGITQQIPNTDFEQWTSITKEDLSSWYTENEDLLRDGKPANAVKTTDAYHGTYALQITTDYRFDNKNNQYDYKRQVQNFQYTQTYKIGGAKYEGNNIDTLIGFYKYTPVAGGDTGDVYCEFYKSGFGVVNSMSGSYTQLTATNTYKMFKMPLDFGAITPDTVFIQLSSSTWPVTTSDKGSKLIIDNLYFASHPLNVKKAPKNIFAAKAYPNPATDFVTIEFDLANAETLQLSIIDITGKIIYTGESTQFAIGKNKLIVNSTTFAEGVYQYQLIGENTIVGKGNIVIK